MYTFTYHHRVRYRECDPMGFLYHTHYVDLFEIARTEAFRALGVPYRELEESGIIMPVIDLSITYKKPSHYDDLLAVTCYFRKIPRTRITIDYEVRHVDEENIRAKGSVTLCFVNVRRNRPVTIPERLSTRLEEAIQKNTVLADRHPQPSSSEF